MKITLKAARTNSGYTQKEAADKLNISEYTLANWEKGKSFPDIPALKRIEEIYGVAYNDIIFLT